MPTAENAILYYEAGQDATAMTALTDSGDNKIFNSAANFWSDKGDYEPTVRPNGVITGGVVTAAASGTNDLVDVAALTCYLAGVETSVSASTDETITRAPTSTHLISSVTIIAAGTIAIVAGTEGASFSTTRGAAGGPPWIPTDSIEIAQVRLATSAAAAITSDEIFQVVGTHQERWDYPSWDIKYTRVSEHTLGYAGVTFITAMDEIHSDDAGTSTATKEIYASYYEPMWAEAPKVEGFVPPENSYSVSSTQVYGQTIGATSSSLGQGSFTIYVNDGVTDSLLRLKGELLWFKFMPNRLKDPYSVCQGKLGISRSFPAGDNISAACTISAEEVSEDIAA